MYKIKSGFNEQKETKKKKRFSAIRLSDVSDSTARRESTYTRCYLAAQSGIDPRNVGCHLAADFRTVWRRGGFSLRVEERLIVRVEDVEEDGEESAGSVDAKRYPPDQLLV